ncbi:MAG: type IV pili twitching motility protein PilT [Candidatus Yanofskybacteria bacterium RIFCSPHIGHO2_02_FULL_38_22b]|uniref:Type IV pili twitching motility protein PilT n=1 Tax=Candidatus Yanofskybacteria bacterium RIFCSPHIGHO2_02_FULL_38_22b TaxID=1802673 RepID=A0A1F8F418_9BACT|nr:MAG: type IV pili twitching motility protein PilT [Candidatus Yanofskybacteria bacterium RIFCSPHIGHO2_01_FULL_39_44]OGN06986.1 MAG: type IV pili twitching motility protein PilT [Candidatus Yanofskybacteria bacterium RIFCSPHIGHO2_02_FULL_38_22b]
MSDYKQQLEELLTAAGQNNASDIHLSPGNYPILRIDGRLVPLSDKKILDADTLEGLASALMGEEKKTRFVSEKELDFSYESSQGNRFRVNIYFTQGRIAATLRLVPSQVKGIDDLNLPSIIKVFAKLSQGFVLVVGPNGHGKSTTLAALVDMINKERSEKIITIEDPIEYIFTPEKSIIDQREVYQDTFSFHKALRSAFRENVNVLMVGEMRDYETMSAAITAAETGHLVFGTLHTNSASQTIERIIDTFPPNQQSQIRNQLANTISGIISQRLIPRIKGGLIPAVEVMIATPAVRTLVRDNRPRQIDLVIETSQEAGMVSLNRSLADLVRRKEIALERAQFYSQNPSELKELLR